MVLYRCSQNSGGTDYSPTYTIKVGDDLMKSSLDSTFEGNSTFNDSVTIGNNVYSVQRMFRNCTNLNREITFPSSVIWMDSTFGGCNKFNQNITIPSSVNSVSWMLSNATAFGKNIYIKGSSYRAINVFRMFNNCNNSLRKNVWFHSSLNNQFNGTTFQTSLTGTAITWTAMTNGFYNATYNIYCYSNYSG